MGLAKTECPRANLRHLAWLSRELDRPAKPVRFKARGWGEQSCADKLCGLATARLLGAIRSNNGPGLLAVGNGRC